MIKFKNRFNYIFITFIKWFYWHCGIFRKFIKYRARKQGELNLILLELFMQKEPIDVDYWCKRIIDSK